MKKILFADNNLNIGGVQKAFVSLLHEIEKDFDITLVLFHQDGELLEQIPQSVKIVPAHGYCELLGITQKQANQMNMIKAMVRAFAVVLSRVAGSALPTRFLIGRKIRYEGYDYAISFMHFSPEKQFYGGTNEYILNAVKAKSKIAFVHCDFLQYGGNLRYAEKQYKRFDRIAICSDSCKNKFITAFPGLKDKAFAVRNCNIYDQIIAEADADSVIYEEDKLNVITVARLSEEKEVSRGIAAVADCIRQGIRVKYHIVGDGPEKAKLENYAKELGIEEHVIFHGLQKNPYRFMTHADLFLLTSRHEAAPMVFDEARCLALPVLTTDTCSAREIVADADAGWVCDNSVQGVCSKLKRILSNPEMLYAVRKQLQIQSFDNTKAIQQFYAMLKGEQ